LDLLPLRAAAGGGSIDGLDATRLVAAGFTLLQRSAPLVRALAGKRAGILLPTSPAVLTALAASDGRGAVLINPLASPSEVAHQLRDANVGAVFSTSALATRLLGPTVASPDLPRVLLDDAPASARVVIGSPAASTRIDLGSHFGIELAGDADDPGRREECAIVYTSAMQGTALGATLTHRNLIANARQTVEAAALTADDHSLALLPLSHLFGLTVAAMAPLLAGARVTTMARFNPIAALDLIERARVTFLVGVPAVFAALLGVIERRGGAIKDHAIRLCICGGAPLTVELQQQWLAATGTELRQGYGLTESSPVALFERVGTPHRAGTLGVPFPGVRVSIRDHATSLELGDGAEGEICVAGETVFSGYVSPVERSPSPTGPARGLRIAGDWLHTGDRGIRRPDGAFEFRGLYKPMFTRSGFNIYPAELERVISDCAGVTSVRVYAIPEPARENDIGVEVSGRGVTEETIRSWCAAHLAHYKQPSEIRIG
jgi:long-chain acyl-CoA synthetase